MTSILNVVIGLVLVFLLFSLAVSALNELWLSWLDKRADFLEEALRELLQDRADGIPAAQRILQHGLVDALSPQDSSPFNARKSIPQPNNIL
jgi:hypothetical protein